MKLSGFRTLLAGLLLVLLLAPAVAQDPAAKAFDFEAWQSTAARAEGVLENSEASTPALETLRATLAEYRAQALALQGTNQARVETLKSQLAALGPPPTEGETEAAEVASRRVELNDQLAKARAPVLAAQEAYNRANGMIGEIDRIIRERIADQLFTLDVSPLNWTHWPEARTALGTVAFSVADEIDEGLNSETQKVLTRQSLPLSIALVVIGLVLMTRARHWLIRAVGFVPLSRREGASEARSLFLSLTQIAVPMAGLWALVAGINATGLVGFRGGMLLAAVPVMGILVFGALWLGRTLFPADPTAPHFFRLDGDQTSRGRRLAVGMGIVLALDFFLQHFSALQDFTDVARIVLSFPVITFGGVLLVLAGLLLEPKPVGDAEVADNPLQRRIFTIVTRGAVLIGVAGPVLAAIGYEAGGSALVLPAIRTLALLGTILILFRLTSDLATLLSGRPDEAPGKKKKADDPDEARLTLTPVVLGFLLILAALPVLALVWGARVSDLLEVWTMVTEGVTFGDRRISFGDFLTFAVVFAIGYTLTRLVQSTLRTTVLPRTKIDAGGRNALLTGTGYLGIFLAAIAAITSAGIDLSNLAIVAGALSVGIGFGLQAIVSNFVSGIILLVERPIKEGDWIEVGAYSGYVKKISVRSTEIETFDRAVVVVPNADFISGTVTNYTHTSNRGRVRVPVGVAYGTDTKRVETILTEIADAHPMVDHRFDVAVIFMGFGADSLDFEIRAILKDVNWSLATKSDMNHEIARRFAAEGIEIPFAQRDINIRNLPALADAIHATKPGAGND